MRNRTSTAFAALTAAALSLAAAGAWADELSAQEALRDTVAELDSQVFDAYNRCDLDAFAKYFTEDVEFYHDKGGASFDRATVVDNTRKYICGKVRRELLPATLKVYPIKGYGAIEEGEHRFCEVASGKCEGGAKFLMIWANQDGQWRMTRVVSYGHRALTDAEKVELERKPGG
ncbi:nuclear transport factor 2 family protein [Pseudomonas sp. CGJS7]|uniref:nuclear transport factor 2 family protein n=1 Tax=Pseudomonas sp. CGJS7 TaxID=3109348 RepID=UPI003008BBA7